MARQSLRFGVAGALATVALLAGASLTSATGYWNVPSDFGQWLGCGYGGGYHAPLMLGPITYECLNPPNEVRLPYAPNPYACAPTCSGCMQGYNGGGADGPPTMMAPAEAPAPATQPAVVPSARRPMIFSAPVQR